jgi:hypothetical protein
VISAAGAIKLAPATASPAHPARAKPIDGHLSGVWSGNEVGQAQHVEILLACYPLPLAYDFIFHQRDMRRWAAKADRSQFEEQHGQGAQALAERALVTDGSSRLTRLDQTGIVAWIRSGAS